MNLEISCYPEDIEEGRLAHQANVLEKRHLSYGSDRRFDEFLDVIEPHVYTTRLIKEWIGNVDGVLVT